MKCDNCNINEATIVYTQNINGNEKISHLCQKCASELGIGTNLFDHFGNDFFSDSFFDNDDIFGLDTSSFINKMFTNLLNSPLDDIFSNKEDIKCEVCGSTFEDIKKSGKLGCSNCYYTFDEQLEPLISQIQSSSKHVGKSPNKINKILGDKSNNITVDQASKMRSNKETPSESKETKLRLKQNLEERLKKAIEMEDYENAAKLRDELKKL